MIISGKYINYIIETINIIRQEIISKTPLGLTDENIFLENYICEIINKVYDYKLINLNEEKYNFPGIDLGNKDNNIGLQITSTKTSAKINDTIKKVTDDTHKVFKTYSKLKFFILTSKQETYTIDVFDESKISFNLKEDILDFDDIYKKSMYLTIDRQKELVDYIHLQTPIVSEKIGIDFYNPNIIKRLVHNFLKDDWKKVQSGGSEYLIEHNFGYIPNVIILDMENHVVMAGVRTDEKYVIVEIGVDYFDGKVVLT